jgi:hypothetical protein
VKTVLTLLLLLSAAVAQAPPAKQRRAIVSAWNECGQSIDLENGLLQELTRSFQTSPPWRVVDAREPEKRRQLIDDIIAEHERRIRLLKEIRQADLQ